MVVLWLLLVGGWLVARVDAVGGRPLVILWDGDPGDYDPHDTSNPIAQSVFRHVCEPLFYEDDQRQVRGLLAEDDYDFGADGRSVTVRLRSGITFHDGLPLDGAAVRASFERLVRLGVSPLANDLRDVRMTVGPDARTVVFTLPEPNYEFVRLVLANPYAAVVSPRAGDAAPPGFVACTGPYRFAPDLYRPGRSLDLVSVPGYAWAPAYFTNRGAARVPRLRFRFIADRDARLAALLDGDGCVLSVSREQMPEVAARPELRRYDATGGVTYLGFNFQRPRWLDPRVRRAVALAMDKPALARMGPFAVADTPLSPSAIGYDPTVASVGYAHDPERARALLAEAGFDTAAEVVLLVPESNTYGELAEVVTAQLRAVGLSGVRVRTVPRADILSQRQDFDLLLFDYAWGDYTALAIFLGPGPRNLLGYADSRVADLVGQARALADPAVRQARVLDAQRAVLADAVWQPLLVRRITFAVNDRCVRGERQSPEEDLLFQDAVTAPFGD
jgi:peptide/nickel transport system substrate-binding protein